MTVESKEKKRDYNRRWRVKNLSRIREYQKKWYSQNAKYCRERQRQWRINNPEKCRKIERNLIRRKKKCERTLWLQKFNPEYRLILRLRNRTKQAVRAMGACKSAPTRKLIGCEIYELQAHLELQFKDGMNWENYGKVWHIDHKRPCRSFDLTDPAQQRQCFHYSNLQPLFATENQKKGGKWLTK